MAKIKQTSPGKNAVGRRGFLKGAASAAAGTAALAAAPQLVSAQERRGGAQPSAPQPSDATLARDARNVRPGAVTGVTERPNSDYMVDVLKALGFEYVAANPGTSTGGIHESLINYGRNSAPEWLTCLHEESAVAMAHGYAKIENKPMLVVLHGTVGIQHAAMAIYNAYGDRVPLYMLTGNSDAAVPSHAAVDMAAMVRDFLKWDHQPKNLAQFAQSAIRAYHQTILPPMAPVMLVLDSPLQTAPLQQPMAVPKITAPAPPSADLASLREIAKALVNAENPRISAGRSARTSAGITLLVELADLLQPSVNGNGDQTRIAFPNRHPLAGAGAGQPDVILNLEGGGFGGGRAKTYSITSAEFLATKNYNVNGNAPGGDVVIAADAEASLPALIEELRKLITPDRRRAFDERGKKHAEANAQTRAQILETARNGWDASPISLARITAELWPLIKDEDWSFVSPGSFMGDWPNRMWNMSKLHHYIGAQGAGGMGYGAPAAVGAALANRKYGRLTINIQTDGDLNYAPGVLWTAVHHKIPLLTIMHNNRGYQQEVMFMARETTARNRGADNAHIGTTLIEPNIDYATMAKCYGMYGEGPITDPKELAPAFKRAIAMVKKGQPVLLDTVTQVRG
ncbi:MAG TPA: thiamine pyrophosphate-dependent enzyme [Bryobacteraceae bacterium]|nr:thiamine pyrophosphate-dependent enzyme [Bryobacteraceae bacterium]